MTQKTGFILLFFLIMTTPGSGQTSGFQSNRFDKYCLQKAPSKIPGRRFKITLSDPWLGRDKMHHFLTSALLSSTGYYFFRDEHGFSNHASQRGGIGFSLSLGLLKEIRDGFQPDNAFSVKDLVADMLGTMVGILLIADF